jgi:hypothetical protein
MTTTPVNTSLVLNPNTTQHGNTELQTTVVLLLALTILAFGTIMFYCCLKTGFRTIGPLSDELGQHFLRLEATQRGKILHDTQMQHVASDFARFNGVKFTKKDVERARALVYCRHKNNTITTVKLGYGVMSRCPALFSIAHSILKKMHRQVTVIVNTYDEPISLPSSLPLHEPGEYVTNEDCSGEKSSRGNHLSLASLTPTAKHDMLRSSPFFTDPTSFPATDLAFPYFSNTKPNNAYADIIACLYNNAGCMTKNLNVDKFSSVPWAQKENRLVWRGSSTGGQVGGKYSLAHYPRFRIIDWSKNTPLRHKINVDIALTSYYQPQATIDLLSLKTTYPLVTYQTIETQFKAKYLLVIDGHTWANRTAAFLCAGSVVLFTTVFNDWVSRQIKPWVYYVPLEMDYSDLDNKLLWLIDHDDEAREIGRRGKEFAERELDFSSMQLYNAALVLEYAKLF